MNEPLPAPVELPPPPVRPKEDTLITPDAARAVLEREQHLRIDKAQSEIDAVLRKYRVHFETALIFVANGQGVVPSSQLRIVPDEAR